MIYQLFTRNRSGQTILELVVAMSVILIGVIGTMTLVIATIHGGTISKMQVTATNLAREGVEIVRNLRDKNALLIEANELEYTSWDYGLTGGTNTHGAKVSAEGDWTLTELDKTLADCVIDINNSCRLYTNANNFYSHDDLGQATPYWRLVILNPICIEGAEYSESIKSPGQDCNAGTKVGIQIISQVQWEEKGRTHLTSFEDRIYNWRW